MNYKDAKQLIGDQLYPAFQTEREELDAIDRWYRWKHDPPHRPRQSTEEYKQIAGRAQTPLLNTVVTVVAQGLFVEGYRSSESPDNSPAWDLWQRNGMDARQTAIHRDAIAYGQSHALVLPGRTLEGESMPAIRGVSALKGMSFWGDTDLNDEFPAYFLRVEPTMLDKYEYGYWVRLYDEGYVFTFQCSASGELTYVTTDEHGLGVCPVVRYANALDLTGRTPGEVEPYIPIAARIDQTIFDRLVVQRFASWKVRYIAGMAQPDTDDEQRATALKLLVSDIIMAEDSDTKFGTLEASDIKQFIEAKESDIRDLAAVSQTPAHHLVGTISNVGAEALAAAEAGLQRKIDERQHAFGESHERLLRLASFANGDLESARDYKSQVVWKDTESRSLSQVADALQKLSQIGVPYELLWERVPGFTSTDVERAKAAADSASGMNRLLEAMQGAVTPFSAQQDQTNTAAQPPAQ